MGRSKEIDDLEQVPRIGPGTIDKNFRNQSDGWAANAAAPNVT